MNHLNSLRAHFTLTIIFVVFVSLAASFFISIKHQYDEVHQRTLVELKKQVAKLARVAERALVVDKQLLYENITQEGTDNKVIFSGYVDSKENITYSTNFSINGYSIDKLGDFFDLTSFNNANKTRKAVIDVNDSVYVAYMSFNEASTLHQIRSDKKGTIILAYDIQATYDNVVSNTLAEKIYDIILAIVITVFAVGLLNKKVASPVKTLENAAKKVATGDYGQQIRLRGPDEIQSLTEQFNIMERYLKNTINEIESNQKYMASIVNNINEGIITLNTAGEIITYNKAAMTIFGYSFHEVSGLHISALVPDNDKIKFGDYIKEGLNHEVIEEPVSIKNIAGKRKSGELFPLEIDIDVVIKDSHTMILAVMTDVTEKMKVDKLKREFVSTVSHELRTPLTSINGTVSLILSGALGDVSEKSKELLTVAERNGKRLHLLINDLLDMDKIIEGKLELVMEEISINEVVENVLTENQAYADKYHVTLKRVGSQKLYRVNADVSRLKQVLTNLVSNACKFSKDGGEVLCGIDELDDGKINVYVQDFGKGIPEEDKVKLFQKFSQVDASDTRSQGGTGLGLAISKELIEKMDGEIGFESESDKGSTFYILLSIVSE